MDPLQAEYLYLQKVIEDFDARSIEIKKWSVGLATGSAAAQYFGQSSLLTLAGAFAVIAFWVVDALWKDYQFSYYPRIGAIEDAYLAGASGSLAPFQVSRAWKADWDKRRRGAQFWKRLFWFNVALPHAVVLAGILVAYFIAPAHA